MAEIFSLSDLLSTFFPLLLLLYQRKRKRERERKRKREREFGGEGREREKRDVGGGGDGEDGGGGEWSGAGCGESSVLGAGVQVVCDGGESRGFDEEGNEQEASAKWRGRDGACGGCGILERGVLALVGVVGVVLRKAHDDQPATEIPNAENTRGYASLADKSRALHCRDDASGDCDDTTRTRGGR